MVQKFNSSVPTPQNENPIGPGGDEEINVEELGQEVDLQTGQQNPDIIIEDDGFELVPLGDGDRAENAAVIIDEYNPSLIKIPVLKLPVEEKARGPLFLYRKKDGGKIASDGLVSITDIYGDY